ncbi:ECF transporter S component [Oceanobacillus sp. CAU 1775]
MQTKKLSILALFIGLSIIGSMIKVPAVIGSVALDAFPALVVAVLLGKNYGAIVGMMGHLMSALIGGLPLGPMHLLIAIEMAIIIWIFGMLYQSNKKYLAGGSFVILNGIIAPLPFILLLSLSFYLSLLPGLIIGSSLNMVLALVFIPRLEPYFKNKFVGIVHD